MNETADAMWTDAALELAARELVAISGVLDFDEVSHALIGCGATERDAAKLVDAALAILAEEVGPLIDLSRPVRTCYGHTACSSKKRCSRMFRYGIEVVHTSGGAWQVGGQTFVSRSAAEIAARREVLLTQFRGRT